MELNRVAYTALIGRFVGCWQYSAGVQERAGEWQLAQLCIQECRDARVALDNRAYRQVPSFMALKRESP